MNSFSKIKEIIKWCFRPDENSPKHSQWSHPLFSFIFGVGVTLIPLIKLSDYLEQSFPDLKGQFSSWTQGNLPIALIFYIVLTILSRMKYFGPSALYDFLWACNISILIMIVGLLKQSYLLISSSMILVAIDQMLWYIDVLGYIFFKKFFIGVAAFLKWPSTPFIKKITTTHHIWFIPLALAILKESDKTTFYSYLLSVFTSWFLIILGRVLTPKFISIKWKDHEEKQYMNLNLAWEIWKDINLGIISKCEKFHFLLYAFAHNLLWSGGNLAFFFILKGLLKIINK